MIGGRNALLGAARGSGYGNWTGNYSDVSLLLRNGAPGLVPSDESPTPKTITAVGNASISTAVAKWNQGSGGSSLALDGSGSYILVNSQMDSFEFIADFTIEGWFWFGVNNIGYQALLGSTVSSDATGFALITETNNALYFYGASANNWNTIVASAQVPTTGAWHHIAVCRSGSTVRLFYDGSQIGSATSSNFIRSGSSLRIGGYQFFPGGERSFNGYIDDLRITQGIARYVAGTGGNAGKMVFAGTNNLALPTAELPANVTDDPSYNSVSLLLRGSGVAGPLVPYDESPTPKTLTVSGNAGISTTTFKYGGSALVAGTSPNFTWGSNRIQVPAGAAFAYGTGDFTVEAWIYPTVASNGIFWGQTVSGTNYFICQTSADRRPAFVFATSGGGTAVFGPVITLNQWSHVAIVRNAGQVRVYSNGVGGTAVACTQNFSDTTFVPTIGGYTHNATQVIFSGLIDDLRVTKGIARYKKDFLPPPAQLPAI